MRNQVDKMFEGVRQKWITFSLESKTFFKITDTLKESALNNKVKKSEVAKLLKAYKKFDQSWVKFKSLKGRKNLKAECEIVFENNEKIILLISPEELLSASHLGGTPKSLKLFKEEKIKGVSGPWKKPNDGFHDKLEHEIPFTEEFTELGYYMYREQQLEKRRAK